MKYTEREPNEKKNECAIMWKDVLMVVLLSVLAILWTDLIRLFERVTVRDLTVVLLILGTFAAAALIRYAARRL